MNTAGRVKVETKSAHEPGLQRRMNATRDYVICVYQLTKRDSDKFRLPSLSKRERRRF